MGYMWSSRITRSTFLLSSLWSSSIGEMKSKESKINTPTKGVSTCYIVQVVEYLAPVHINECHGHPHPLCLTCCHPRPSNFRALHNCRAMALPPIIDLLQIYEKGHIHNFYDPRQVLESCIDIERFENLYCASCYVKDKIKYAHM